MSAAKEKPPLNIVGEVEGCIAIMADNLVDDVDQFVDVAEMLSAAGAVKVTLVASLFNCILLSAVSEIDKKIEQ